MGGRRQLPTACTVDGANATLAFAPTSPRLFAQPAVVRHHYAAHHAIARKSRQLIGRPLLLLGRVFDFAWAGVRNCRRAAGGRRRQECEGHERPHR
jgi:hypothetical protein